MNYLYAVKSGRYDYAHTMFVTSDLSAANRFIENYNKMFSIDKWEDYVEYRAYIEIMPDYVPELNEDYYTCNTTVYSVLANKDIPTFIYDGSLVMGNLMNAAADLGIASCWIHRAKEEFESAEGKAILKGLGIKGNYEGIGHLILGYASKPDADPVPRKADYVYII